MPDQEPNANAESAAVNPVTPETPPAAGQQNQADANKGESVDEKYKGLQRKISKLESELNKAKSSNDIGELKGLLQELISRTEGNQALTLDMIEDTNYATADLLTDKPAKPKFQNYQQYQATEVQRKSRQAQADYDRRVVEAQKRMKEEMQEAGISPDDFKDIWEAREINPLEAAEKLVTGVARKHKEGKMDSTAIDKIVEERLNKKLVDMGLLRADMTQGVGGGMSRASVARLSEQMAMEDDPKRRRELMEKVDAAWKAGLIK